MSPTVQRKLQDALRVPASPTSADTAKPSPAPRRPTTSRPDVVGHA